MVLCFGQFNCQYSSPCSHRFVLYTQVTACDWKQTEQTCFCLSPTKAPGTGRFKTIVAQLFFSVFHTENEKQNSEFFYFLLHKSYAYLENPLC